MTKEEFIIFIEEHLERYKVWRKDPINVVEDYKDGFDGIYDDVRTKINVTYFKDKLRVAVLNEKEPFVFSWNEDTNFLLIRYPFTEDESYMTILDVLNAKKESNNGL